MSSTVATSVTASDRAEPMRVARGLVVASGLFLAAFALHIIGGATDQGWLFAVAVVLVFVTATGFPLIAALTGLPASRRGLGWILAAGFAEGTALTAATFWAANGRSMAWWTVPLAAAAAGLAVIVTAWLSPGFGRASGRARPARR